jgi:transcriptional regulator with XRE-family HTH domain
MGERESTLLRREIAYRLADAVTTARLSNKKLADRVGQTQSTISHWLHGNRPIREADVAAVLTACQVPRAQWDQILGLVRCSPPPVWLLLDGPRQHTALRDHVDGAREVVEVAATHMPWLARTPDYTKAWAGRPGCFLAADRLGLTPDYVRDPARWPRGSRITSLIHEAALWAQVGGPVVMARQWTYLRWLTGLPYVQVRVIPAQAHLLAGTAGSFTLVTYAEQSPLVLRHDPGGLACCEDPGYVGEHEAIVRELTAAAWDEERSLRCLHDVPDEKGQQQ